MPGFLLGRRYEAVSGQPRYFNFYLTQSADVLKSAAYLERLDHPTPMTRTIMSEIFKDMIRTVCHRTLRLGAMRGSAAVAVRFMERSDQNALKATVEELDEGQGGGLRRNLVGGERQRIPVSEEERLRGGDRRSRRVCMSRRCGVEDAEKIAAHAGAAVSGGGRRRLSPALRDQNGRSRLHTHDLRFPSSPAFTASAGVPRR